ncbi:DUF2281 domain-containing protein [Microcoleus vaginatus GB1-A2]|uniref:DUF2281 domain-containing protein n=1 Tax=Microcoleus vaginatus TaxID=119532 RepID=UPI0032A72C34
MTAKDQLLQELDQVPEPLLLKVLEFVRSLKTEEEQQKLEAKAWQAYLDSERERKEIYRRLANSYFCQQKYGFKYPRQTDREIWRHSRR